MDPAQWQVWWRFNGEGLIDLRRRLAALEVTSGDDDFYLGRGESGQGGQALTEGDVRTKVVPALRAVLREGGDMEMLRGALIALARIERSLGGVPGQQVDEFSKHYLAQRHQACREAGIVALGIRGSPSSLDVLSQILLDSEKGRKLVGAERVGFRDRSLAAYSLGLMSMGADLNLRHEAVDILIAALQDNPTMPYDIQVACLIGLGLAPLERCDGADPPPGVRHVCRGTQLGFLLYFYDTPDQHTRLKAHSAIPLGRLAAGAIPETRAMVVAVLRDELADRTAPYEIHQSTVIALGLAGDADDDELDQEIREALMKAAQRGDRITKRFALVALGQVGGNPGSGEGEGAAEVKRFLLRALARAKADEKPWAALSLGVYARTRAAHTLPVSEELTQALTASLSRTRDPNLTAACCVSLGLLRDVEATELIEKKLAKSKDPGARGFAALALGLAASPESGETLAELLYDASADDGTFMAGAMGLRLLGSTEVTSDLATWLGQADGPERRSLLATALGVAGDRRAVEPLVELLADASKDAIARGSAARALGELCDTSPAPWSTWISSDLNYNLLTSTLLSYSGNGSGILEMR